MSEELIVAIYNNDYSKVETLLLDSKIDVNFQYQTKTNTFDKIYTPLQMAASRGHKEIVKLLLSQKKIDTLAKSGAGRTALHIAAYNGYLDICKILLPVSDLTMTDNRRLTPYANAVVASRSNAIKDENIKRQALVIINFLKVPTFVVACAKGDLKLVKEMVEEEHVDINAFYNNLCGLHAACLFHRVEVVDYLLSLENINVNIQDPEKGTNALQMISKPEISATLLAKSYKKNTDVPFPLQAPSDYGQFSEREEIAMKLIEHGADVNLRDHEGLTPLMSAVVDNSLDIVKILVEKGNADIYLTASCRKNSEERTIDAFGLAEELRSEIYRYLNGVKYQSDENTPKTKQFLRNVFSNRNNKTTLNDLSNLQDHRHYVKV